VPQDWIRSDSSNQAGLRFAFADFSPPKTNADMETIGRFRIQMFCTIVVAVPRDGPMTRTRWFIIKLLKTCLVILNTYRLDDIEKKF
jgi:hypothetical protein